MEVLAEHVKELFGHATSEEKRFFRKTPSLANIGKEMENFKRFSSCEKLEDGRVGMSGIVVNDGLIVGYHSFCIMNNASATPYEKKYIDMGSGMNYVYGKKLFVHPDYRSQGFGTSLVVDVLNLAKGLDKHYIADIEKDNYSMSNILTRQEFQIDFNWSGANGIQMVRFYHD